MTVHDGRLNNGDIKDAPTVQAYRVLEQGRRAGWPRLGQSAVLKASGPGALDERMKTGSHRVSRATSVMTYM